MQSGISVPTIKFYLREGLVPPGLPVGRNQAVYERHHVERLRLIKVLTSVGKLSLSAVADIVASIDSGDSDLTRPRAALHPEGVQSTAADMLPRGDPTSTIADTVAFFCELGWPVDPDGDDVDTIAAVLDALRMLGCDCDVRLFTQFAKAADQIAHYRWERAPIAPASAAAARTELLTVVLVVLLRMAHEPRAAV
jgi:DNA-binding transcriptional MerR regulator